MEMITRKKTVENKNEGEINIDITEKEKCTNWDTLEKVIVECPDDTSPVQME